MNRIFELILTAESPQSFPVGDTQFWIVTTIAVLAAAFILWRAFGGRLRRRKAKPRKKNATLTIEGRLLDRRSPGRRDDAS